jgi:protein-S-isoprenylcysteine O-methyltransferase Ste14
MQSSATATFLFWFLVAAWFAFALVFLLRRRPASPRETQRSRRWRWGVVLQALAYMVIWSPPGRRVFGTAPARMSEFLQVAWAAVVVLLAIGSVLLVMLAIRALGRQWAVAARLVEGHQLITTGPYAWIRNPIYTGMLGMLLATGLTISHGWALAAAIVLFLTGTTVRVRSEEKLLRATFGAEFGEYCRRVPALLPGIY